MLTHVAFATDITLLFIAFLFDCNLKNRKLAIQDLSTLNSMISLKANENVVQVYLLLNHKMIRS